MKPFYRQFDHTSDLGIEVFGSDIKSLFINAALSLTDLITDLKHIGRNENCIIEINGEDSVLLLREFLAELLYLFQVESFIGSEIKIIEMNTTFLKAELTGEKVNPKRHGIRREIKSVTYHQLGIKQTDSGYKARIVLDI